jgi:hypothetical protein
VSNKPGELSAASTLGTWIADLVYLVPGDLSTTYGDGVLSQLMIELPGAQIIKKLHFERNKP